MSASLARTLFRPAARSAPAATKGTTTCPAARFFPSSPAAASGSSSVRTSASARTLNAIAHISVAAALVASSVSFLNHPDPLLFDHPPRSAIGFMPSRYIVAAGGADHGPSSRPRPRLPLSEGQSTPLGDATKMTTTTRTATARAFLDSTSPPGMVAYTSLPSLSDNPGAAATVIHLMAMR